MFKLLAALKARDGLDRAGFRNAVLTETGELFGADLMVAELIVNLVDVDPGDAEWVRPGEARPEGPPYDALIELAGATETIARAAAAIERQFGSRCAQLAMYRTRPMPARVDRVRVAGQRSSGVKYIVLCRFHDDMAASAVKRSWAHHVPLALRVHVGADIYIRHWVEETLSPAAPPVEGVTELHFPTVEDMRERWFVDDGGRRQIIQDIGHFLASGTRCYTSEHVLRIAGPG